MASENETVAEVLAEFGEHIELMRRCRCVGVSLWNCMKFKLRIEAAWKREMSNVEQDALETGALVAALADAAGEREKECKAK